MTTNDYLKSVLRSQDLLEDGPELRDIERNRKDVERLLRAKFGEAPKIRYGGSHAKKTMIRVSYDVDIHCYFARGCTVAGETLKEIYDNVAKTLEGKYILQRKQSALRLTRADEAMRALDLHIDVVPGRFVEGDEGDVNIFQNEINEDWRKTNLDVHIRVIRDSGLRDAIRLLKLWKVRYGLTHFKTFILELLVIGLLRGHKDDELEDQLSNVLKTFRDESDQLSVKDPANPEGNELSTLMDEARVGLCTTAGTTLSVVENSGWEGIFGSPEIETDEMKRARLKSIAVGIPREATSKPWGMF